MSEVPSLDTWANPIDTANIRVFSHLWISFLSWVAVGPDQTPATFFDVSGQAPFSTFFRDMASSLFHFPAFTPKKELVFALI